MLDLSDTALVVIDVQGKLATLMYRKDYLFRNLRNMIRGAKTLGLPIIWNEQLPDKLGPTISEIKNILLDMQPIVKNSFSCCENKTFLQRLRELNPKKLLVVGIETHVCVYQTSMDLLDSGYEVYIVADATSSRTEDNYRFALERMRSEGVKMTTVEMALFELLKIAEGDKFKEIINIIK